MTVNEIQENNYRIELLNEFSMSVYNRLLRYVQKNEINLDDKELFVSLLFKQFEENLNLNLFTKKSNELERIENYWKYMNLLTKEIVDSKY
ncbi:antitoxin [Vagococcus fluvialis]|uniref:antitoxin n=1 Tax=Vagococcus fluvialis TaxID=2738 RepID=UPI001777A1A6|nr:antitoxin [Listeria monocytogenes]HCQ0947981.1 antitoxin [Listeria monocytogenes]